VEGRTGILERVQGHCPVGNVLWKRELEISPVLRDAGQANSKDRTLNYRKANSYIR